MPLLNPVPSQNNRGATNRQKKNCIGLYKIFLIRKNNKWGWEVLHFTLQLFSAYCGYCTTLVIIQMYILATSDSIDKIFSNPFQLLTFVMFNLNIYGVKSFHPFFYVQCVRKHQEAFGLGCLVLLKYCCLLFNIFNITNFDLKVEIFPVALKFSVISM